MAAEENNPLDTVAADTSVAAADTTCTAHSTARIAALVPVVRIAVHSHWRQLTSAAFVLAHTGRATANEEVLITISVTNEQPLKSAVPPVDAAR